MDDSDDGDGGSVVLVDSTPGADDEEDDDDDDDEDDDEDDDVWRPETATPAWRNNPRRSRNSGRRSDMARSLAGALDLVRACRALCLLLNVLTTFHPSMSHQTSLLAHPAQSMRLTAGTHWACKSCDLFSTWPCLSLVAGN